MAMPMRKSYLMAIMLTNANMEVGNARAILLRPAFNELLISKPAFIILSLSAWKLPKIL